MEPVRFTNNPQKNIHSAFSAGRRNEKSLWLNIKYNSSNPSPNLNRPEQVYSPITDLTLNLGELSTISDNHDNTPKRKLCSTGGNASRPTNLMKRHPSFTQQISKDEGCFLESPSPVDVDSPFFDNRFSSLDKDAPPSAAFRRFQAMPVPFSGFDPTPTSTRHDSRLGDQTFDASPVKVATPKTSNLFGSPNTCSWASSHDSSFEASPHMNTKSTVNDDDDNSQDSGVCLDKDISKDGVEFKFPVGPAPRRIKSLSVTGEDANSPHKYSPRIKSDSPLSFSKRLFSPSKSKAEETDDGFLELLDMGDEVDKENTVPKGMEKLFSAPLLAKQAENEPIWNPVLSDVTNSGLRRGLFRSPSAPKLHKSQTFCVQRVNKRSEPCSSEDEHTPRVTKRRRSILNEEDKENNASLCVENKMNVSVSHNKPKLQRCQSDTEAIVKAAERFDNKTLIGDFSTEYILPMVKGKHQDLKSITPDTVADLINGEYKHVVEKFIIIDCRYPYEYEGGHIKGAKNMYTKDEVYNTFLKTASKMPHTTSSGKRNIIIFHCEFSSERAPKLCRFLRSQDRELNKDNYPGLDYPELYLLDQGYKNFFTCHPTMCTPEQYRTMLDKDYEDDLKKFRTKSKSWSGDRKSLKGRLSVRSGLKF